VTPNAQHERGVRRTAYALIGINLVIFAGLWMFGQSSHRGLPSIWLFGGFAAAFAVVSAMPMRLDFSEHRVVFTLTDAVLVTGLFYLGSPWLGLTATVGEVVACAITGLPALKTVFNAASRIGAGTAAGAAFAALQGGHSRGAGAWPAAIAAVLCWGFLNVATVAAVLARAEGRRYEQAFSRLVPTAIFTTILAAPLGLLVAELLRIGPIYPVLTLPVVIGVWLTNRYAAFQRDEHLRVERLYDATARTAQIPPDLDVVAVVADEARRLLTGTAALCCMREGAGLWMGRTALAAGTSVTRNGDVAIILDCTGPDHGAAKSMAIPEMLRPLAPDADELVVARSPKGSPVEMVIAVLRRSADWRGNDAGLGDTLTAFAAHGAVIASNGRLLAKVQRTLASQLKANQRKDEFVATISHELRTPLTVMLGTTQTLLRLDDRISSEERSRMLGIAVREGKRLQLLIEDILLVAASEHGDLPSEMSSIGVLEFAEEVLAHLPTKLRARVRLENTTVDAAFVSDRRRLSQIVLNLAENAGKYAPGSPIELVLATSSTQVSIAVVDHGPGIPEGDRERIFERFVQLDQTSTRYQGGAGLGLSICRKLATQLGATLELDPTEGGGCTFTITYPRLHLRKMGDLDLAGPRRPQSRPGDLLRRPDGLPMPIPTKP
jgi:signal transduction histidine kinase